MLETARAKLASWLPFQQPSQEKAFAAVLKNVTEQHEERPKLLVLHGFRGCRKSAVASQYCAENRRFPWPISTEYHNLSATPWPEIQQLIAKFSSPQWHMLMLLRDLAAMAVPIFIYVGLWRFLWHFVVHPGQKHWTRNPEMGGDEFLTVAALTFSVVGMLLIWTLPRRVIVFDDAFAASVGPVPAARDALDTLAAFATQQSVLLITSNEGIAACFGDRSPSRQQVAEFPEPSQAELTGLVKRIPELQSYKFSSDFVQQMIEQNLYHHAHSISWWLVMAEQGAFIDSANREEAKEFIPGRDALWQVAITLDCETSQTFRGQSLCRSKAISEADQAKLVKLTGVEPPVGYPRRLALAYCLLKSQTEEEAQQAGELCRLLEAAASTDPRTNDYFESYIHPLLGRGDRNKTSSTWVSVTGVPITHDPVIKVAMSSAMDVYDLKQAVKAYLEANFTGQVFNALTMKVYVPGKDPKQDSPALGDEPVEPATRDKSYCVAVTP